MITVSGLTKQYGDRTVVDDVSFTLEPGTVTGFLGPERRRQDDDDADDDRPGRPHGRRSALVDGRSYAELPNPGAVVGTLLDASAPCTPAGPDARTCGSWPTTIGVRRARVDEVLDLVGLTDAGRRRIGGYSLGMRQRLGHRRGAARRPAGADLRRAGQRAGPGGHPVDARPAARARRPRRHGAAVQPPARRGRAHRRPAAGDRQRPDRRRRSGRRAARRRRRRRSGRPTRTRWPADLSAAGLAVRRRRRTARWSCPGADRRAGRRRSPPPAATCSPSCARPSAASRTSSSSSPPRHDRHGADIPRPVLLRGARNDRPSSTRRPSRPSGPPAVRRSPGAAWRSASPCPPAPARRSPLAAAVAPAGAPRCCRHSARQPPSASARSAGHVGLWSRMLLIAARRAGHRRRVDAPHRADHVPARAAARPGAGGQVRRRGAARRRASPPSSVGRLCAVPPSDRPRLRPGHGAGRGDGDAWLPAPRSTVIGAGVGARWPTRRRR